MKKLASISRVSLLWLWGPGHTGVARNEGADRWANIEAANPLIGPEPTCGVSHSLVRKRLGQRVADEHRSTEAGLRTRYKSRE